MIAKVAVEKTAYHFDKLFDYALPKTLAAGAEAGRRVLVPFGGGAHLRQGMIFAISSGSDMPEGKLKNIVALLDEEPVLSGELLALAQRLAERTFCPIYEAVRAMLPPGINYRPVYMYKLNGYFEDWERLSDEERRVAELLKKKKNGMDSPALQKAFGLESAVLFDSMTEKGVLMRIQDAKRKIGDETLKMARLTHEQADKMADGGSMLKKATVKQKKVLEFLAEAGAASVKEILYFTAASPAVAENLAEKGAVEFYEQPAFRKPYKDSLRRESAEDIELSPEQQSAYEGICELTDRGTAATALLFGVTGSGKTQVFIKLIEREIKAGKQVILMVPEISLTPQMISKFIACFGGRVAVMHSALSVGERLDEWKRIKDGSADIIIGTRSAVFAPAEKLGLIIMDEEQEQSYKSDRAPRYHARDAASFRAAWHKVPLLLASATPSIETYYRAASGRSALFSLRQRYGGAKLPETVIVDMKEEAMAGNAGVLSEALAREIGLNLEHGEQSILLQNRRGYQTVARCAECSETKNCPRCSIPLTYHMANGRLMCHYCGYSEDMTTTCSKCGSRYVMYSGVGTQKVQEELEQLFPDARILRMDLDTTMAKFSHDRAFAEFSAGNYDIMVGTQMVAKGLDFPRVTLVGVLSADMSLYNGDYRSYERTFGLLTQVVGRCGRAALSGRAYIQTFSPEHTIVERAAAQDYLAFYKDEIINRKIMLYPPFCEMGVVAFLGEREELTAEAAAAFAKLVEQRVGQMNGIPLRLLGPTPSRIAKIADKWRWKLIIKYRGDADFFAFFGAVLREFASDKRFVKIQVTADPYFDGMV